jgi:thermostable 8-oxoguanine DNA glycosylase
MANHQDTNFVLDDVRYDQVKLLHCAGKLQKFIQESALKDARAKGFTEYEQLLVELDKKLGETIGHVDMYLFNSSRNPGIGKA